MEPLRLITPFACGPDYQNTQYFMYDAPDDVFRITIDFTSGDLTDQLIYIARCMSIV